MDKNINDIKISKTFFRVASKFSEIDQKSECELNDESYVNTEMRIVSVIKEHEGIHVSGIADILGITKGAVSQELLKLEKRGLVIKERDETNQSRLLLKLTDKGEKLYDVHRAFHHELDELIADTLKGATEDNKLFLKNFLDSVEHKILNIYIK